MSIDYQLARPLIIFDQVTKAKPRGFIPQPAPRYTAGAVRACRLFITITAPTTPMTTTNLTAPVLTIDLAYFLAI